MEGHLEKEQSQGERKMVFGAQGVIRWSKIDFSAGVPAQPNEGTLKPNTKEVRCTCHLVHAQMNFADLPKQDKADVTMYSTAPWQVKTSSWPVSA